ncbi:MAG TPA: FkbM family methyltransferase [Candidatus Dormibacteraeota bacterium]|nr:FkbM family methyltransferase [Candidatus Dormibacteraeota bacterium]
MRTRIAASRVARREVTLRMRDGSSLRCRIADSGGPLSVYVDRDYDIPGFDWSKAGCILDIGAHVGSFTVWASRRAPRARLVAVEPNPQTYDLLLRNIHANGLNDRAVTLRAALGAEEGVAHLERLEHSLGTRLVRTTAPADAPLVGVRTLRDLLAQTGASEIDFLKIDCEGQEYEVFGSLEPDLLRSVRAVACEYHPEPGQDVSVLESVLRDAGFEVVRPDSSLGVLWATRRANR